MANLLMTDIQTLPLTLSAVDADGNPTALPPGSSLTVVPASAGAVAPDPTDTTGTKFIFTPNSAAGNLGDLQIQASVTVGGATLTGTLGVTVGASAAAQIVMTPGSPA